MAEIKNLDSLAEVEFCLGRYLDGNIKGIMTDVRKDLTRKQDKERADYQSSWRGALHSFAEAANPSFNDSTGDYLRATGEWNSKTTDDFLAMCRAKVLKDKNVYHDIVSLTVEWRNAVVAEIGQKRYDEASKALGTDLARAYIDYRLQQTMTNVLIDENTPRSTSEYIMKKGAEGSLMGFASVLSRSNTDEVIAREAEARYRANGWEWAGAKATSFAIDTAATFGFGSWGKLAQLAGLELVMTGIDAASGVIGKVKNKPLTIEQCISQGVFGSQKNVNVFDDVRKRTQWIDAEKSRRVAQINGNLKRPVSTDSFGGIVTRFFANSASGKEKQDAPKATAQNKALAKSESKVESKAEKVEVESGKKDMAAASSEPNKAESETIAKTSNPDEQLVQEQQANQAGWSELMGELGFSGLGDIGHNLGYVIAMLPDILVGMMTGKTQSLHLRDNMIPMASVVAGMFVKSPILKTLLIGMGGMNLLNKAGHESLARHTNPDGQRFKQYQDEPLNSRITNPVINGNTLVANIDRTPCSILLPDNVVAAHQAGALPLNTLANAVLARHDAGAQMAQSNYRSAMQDNNLQNNRQIR